LEAKWSQTTLDRQPPKGALSGYLPYGRVEEDGRVADIEDVYLGEDGSIQCVVTWSLVAMESLSAENCGGDARSFSGRGMTTEVEETDRDKVLVVLGRLASYSTISRIETTLVSPP
jgi:hypothetical protein